jgi:hypothetical protein
MQLTAKAASAATDDWMNPVRRTVNATADRIHPTHDHFHASDDRMGLAGRTVNAMASRIHPTQNHFHATDDRMNLAGRTVNATADRIHATSDRIARVLRTVECHLQWLPGFTRSIRLGYEHCVGKEAW